MHYISCNPIHNLSSSSLFLYPFQSGWYEFAQDRPSFDELMTILLNYSRNPTYYLNISVRSFSCTFKMTSDFQNDPCLTSQRFRKQRLSSQYSYEMQPYPRHKGVYKQQSMDGTISTFDGDYQEALLESSLRRQSSNFSSNSNRYRFTEDIGMLPCGPICMLWQMYGIVDKKNHLKRHQSALSDNPEENENNFESGNANNIFPSINSWHSKSSPEYRLHQYISSYFKLSFFRSNAWIILVFVSAHHFILFSLYFTFMANLWQYYQLDRLFWAAVLFHLSWSYADTQLGTCQQTVFWHLYKLWKVH